MKYFFTLMTILLSLTAFCQTVILAETFPLNKFNSTGQGGQSGSFNGTFSAWSLKSSANSIVEVDDAPIGGTTMALPFATGGNGANSNPRVDTATSPNVDISSSASCSVGSMSFQFEWYTMQGESNDYEVKLQFSGDGGSTWNTVWTITCYPPRMRGIRLLYLVEFLTAILIGTERTSNSVLLQEGVTARLRVIFELTIYRCWLHLRRQRFQAFRGTIIGSGN